MNDYSKHATLSFSRLSTSLATPVRKLLFAILTMTISVFTAESLQAQQFAPIGPLSFTKAFAGANPLPQTLTVGSTGASFRFSWTATTNNGGNWLSVTNVSYNGSGSPSTPETLAVAATPASNLAAGTYTGQILLTGGSGGSITMSIPVTLTVASVGTTYFDSLPGEVSFSLVTNGSTPPAQSIQVRNGGTGTLNWSLTASTIDGGNWLGVSATTGAAPSALTITLQKANLPGQGSIPGTYIGKLVLQSSNGNVSIPVSVIVGDTVFRQVNGLSFTKPFNGINPLPQTIAGVSTGDGMQFTTTTATATGGAWLSVSESSYNNCFLCTTPHNFQAVVNANPILAVGTYTGQIVLTIRDGSQAITIPVTLTITPGSVPFLNNLPGQLAFSLATNSATVPNQDIELRNVGATGVLDWTVTAITSDGGNWLTVSSPSGTAPSRVSVGISIPNLPNGGHFPATFLGELIFQTAAGNITVPVSATVGDSVFWQVNPLSFVKIAGQTANPLPQTLTVATSGSSVQFTTLTTTAAGGSWLSVGNISYNNCYLCSTPQTLSAVVNAPATMPPGTYTGQILAISRDGSQTLTVPVTLTVFDPSAVPAFDNLPGNMTFSLQTNGGTPPSQTIQVRNAGSGTLNWTLDAFTSDQGNWLNVSVQSGAAPSLVTVSIVKENLPTQSLFPGTFTGELVFRTAGQSVSVPISVIVGDNVFRQVNALNFVKPVGTGANPLPQTLIIGSTGTSVQFSVTVSTSSGGTWLDVINTSYNRCSLCPTPQALTAVVNASPTLSPGTYTGQIVITARDGSQALTIPVSLQVADPAAGPMFDNMPGQMSFSIASASDASPSQTLQIRNAGSGSLDWTLEATTADHAAWLNVSVQSGTAPSVVTVSITKPNLPSQGLLPGTFVGELVFRTAGQAVTVPISVVVGDNVYWQVNPISFFKPVGSTTNPLPQTIAIASSGTDLSFTVATYTATGGSWLSAQNISYNNCNLCPTPQTITALVTAPPTMPVGTYTGQIVITARDGSQEITIPVTLTVANPATVPVFEMPGHVDFFFEPGTAAPGGQALQILNSGAGSLNWTVDVTTADNGSWLNVSTTGGTGPSTLNVSIVKQNLPGQGLLPGNFIGHLAFRTASGTVTVPVRVTVADLVFQTPNVLSFAKPASGNPFAQTVDITSLGGTVAFTVNAYSGGGNWLSVSTPSGCYLCSTTSTLTVTVNASALLVARPYLGEIVVTSREGAQSLTIPVILTGVTGTLPASIAATSGSGQTASINTQFASRLVATVKDSGGNPLSGISVTFTAPGAGASGSFAGAVNTVTTDAQGKATSGIFTANAFAGTYNVIATAAGVATPATFSLTNTDPSTLPFALAPTPGSGPSQSFTFNFPDQTNFANIAGAQIVINSALTAVNSCYVLFARPDVIALAGDTGLTFQSTSLGAPAVLQNSQCVVLASLTSQTGFGKNVTLTLSVVFKQSFAGAKTIWANYNTNSGVSVGYQVLGTYTATPTVPVLTTNSVSPSSGSGQAKAFTFTYFDTNGAPDISGAQIAFNSTLSGANACYLLFSANNIVSLASDDASTFTTAVLGKQTALQNSQCTVFPALSYQTQSGQTLSFTVFIAFKPSFTGTKNIYSSVNNNAGTSSGFLTPGTWTVTGPPAISVNSVSPSAATGPSQALNFVYEDPAGAADISSTQIVINPTATNVNSCSIQFNPSAGTIALATDTGAGSTVATIGQPATVQNSQCIVNAASSAQLASGNYLTLTLFVTMKNSGSQTIYSSVAGASASTNLAALGTWNVTSPPIMTPVSVTPFTGGGAVGSTQFLTFTLSHPSGAANISGALIVLYPSLQGASACYILWGHNNNLLSLASDNAQTFTSATAGTAGLLNNSQCTVDASKSFSVQTGNTINLTVAVAFKAVYQQFPQFYSWVDVQGQSGVLSGWLLESRFSVQ